MEAQSRLPFLLFPVRFSESILAYTVTASWCWHFSFADSGMRSEFQYPSQFPAGCIHCLRLLPEFCEFFKVIFTLSSICLVMQAEFSLRIGSENPGESV